MSIKEIIALPAVWGTAALGIIGSIIAYIANRRETKAKVGKTEIEKDEIAFNLKVKMESYYSEQIDKLNARVDAQDRTIGVLNEKIRNQDKRIADQDEIILGLKSEVSLYKTVNS